MDVTIGVLDIRKYALKSEHLPMMRSALTSFDSLNRLTLGGDIPLNLLTNDFLVTLKYVGVDDFDFRSKAFKLEAGEDGWGNGYRLLRSSYVGDYPDVDVGLMAFLFRGSEAQDESVSVKFPAARVPRDIGEQLLKVNSIICHSYRIAKGRGTVRHHSLTESTLPNMHH